ncbi:glycosyltransferase family 2 protein [Aureitalea marina]|uniref:Glycosyl transferase n=1 Tax=Aureitalea marina TaxID=930804 RepID=A0A2S7KS91_9FLAO|nr:glycosyltransferase family 2 protein [Aureitalea marina]PQB05494.1 glycosyl transferase [Aureitalea marina]
MPSKGRTKHIDDFVPGLVSVVSPVFNSAPYLQGCIQSVLDQTYTQWEMLLVDDASTDGSSQIMKKAAAMDKRIRIFFNQENQGAAHSRNKATEEAKGEYIAFLDSDDLWEPDKLNLQIQQMESTGNPVCFSNYIRIDEQGHELGIRIKAIPELSYQKQLRNNYIGNLTGIYRVSSIGKIMSPAIRKRQDWAVWLEAIRRSSTPALGLDHDLARYRVGQTSISSKKWRLLSHNYRFYREYLHFSGIKSFTYLLIFLWEYFLNRPRWIERYR